MILTETENKVLKHLRYGTKDIMQRNNSVLDNLSDEEFVSLYNKMDALIEDIGNTRRSLGNFDEMYVLELSCIKETLLKEIHRRKMLKNARKRNVNLQIVQVKEAEWDPPHG